jgi:pimeloyl-ACP methyl ester carboxylesterase
MPFFDRDGLHLWFEVLNESSSGVPRVYVNGSGSTIDEVRPLLPLFGGGRPVVALDHRGMGRSDTPSAPPDMGDFADDVRAVVEHLGWSMVDVIGVSFGGMVAQEMACRSPDRIRRLVLACTSTGGAGGSSYPLHELSDLDEEVRRRVLPRLQDSRFDDEWLRTHQGPAERLVGTAGRAPNTVGFRMQMDARRRHDVWDRLGGVTVPTFVASGAFDGIAPPDNGRRIASRVPGATFRAYQGGHLFFLQDPAFFVDLEIFLTDAETGVAP